MVWWQVILFPFAILYDGITRFRNHLFNIGSTPSFEFDANVISVGNLAVGGTGKTPVVMWLAEHFLAAGKQVAILSRGYGRSTRGFRRATPEDTPKTIGDESFMYCRRYMDRGVLVAVAEERAWAIPWILTEQPDNDIIILDDAYQHREVKPSVSLLLTTWSRPFYRDFVMPAGRLRESRSGARRADLVTMTKCPAQITEDHQKARASDIARYSDAPVSFSTTEYGDLVPFEMSSSGAPARKFVAVAGLASNAPFRKWCEQHFPIETFIGFPDHHRYSSKNVARLVRLLGPDVGLITTEKDAVKLMQFDELKSFLCFYVPIQVRFLVGEREMLDTIEGSLRDYQREVPGDEKDN